MAWSRVNLFTSAIPIELNDSMERSKMKNYI